MSSVMLSKYRLKSKSVRLDRPLVVSKGRQFDVYRSVGNKNITQYYILDKNWDISENYTSKIKPLAHVFVDNLTGKVKFSSFQPQDFSLNTKADDLKKRITHFLPKIQSFQNNQNSTY